ncbi:MAG TPA: glycosyltransferase family 2 protein [Nitrospiraceae bacterium]|nr:glycosyltransferase family 2 protein [Nitrospiraceae bacterium]
MTSASSLSTVTCLVITKNEEANIQDCLKSAQWATEVLVVDAESRDRTVELARACGAKVSVRSWPGFGLQKNFGMAQASSDWILILDADERVTEELRREITDCLNGWTSGAPVAYRIPRRNFFYGDWVQGGGVYPDYQIRLFRRGMAQYNDVAVHENLLVDGEIGTLAGHIDHYTERNICDHFRKFGLYTTLAAQEKSKSVKGVNAADLLVRPLVVFFKTYLAKKGYRDGVRGLIVCTFASMYTFVKYAKLWTMTSSAVFEADTR